MKNKTIAWMNIILAVLIFSAVLFTGCDIFYGKTITVNKGISHFSFERPEGYSIGTFETFNNSEYQYTYIFLSSPENDLGYSTSHMSISANFTSEVLPNAESMLEYSLSTYEHFNDFELLGRFTETVAGIEGQGIIVSYSLLRDENHPVPGRATYIAREIAFGQGDLIWSIEISSDASFVEEGIADFEHVLETFTLLD